MAIFFHYPTMCRVNFPRFGIRRLLILALACFVLLCAGDGTRGSEIQRHEGFDVVIAGGSTAAFAAAIASAKSGARTALLEPTDWVGGQLTSSGVPAVDEAWHKISDPSTGDVLLNVAKWARYPKNMTPSFLSTLNGLDECGDCWVSRFCFRPQEYLRTQLRPLEQSVADNLIVFRETVVKRVELDHSKSRITALVAIQRKAIGGSGYDRLPSEDLADWYSPEASARFRKRVLRFGSGADEPPVFVDATEWGEVLALSGADYLQGTENREGEPEGNDICGQSTVYGFVQQLHSNPVAQEVPNPEVDGLGLGDYEGKPNAWELIWTYRRIHGQGKPSPGDLCLQNWGYSAKLGQGGNDYPFEYLFKSREATAAEVSDWRGGINLKALSDAEQRAYGWHHWFRKNAPPQFDADQISLAGEELGTGHGLAKLPYIRDTRRAIGLDGFMLRFDELTGPAKQQVGHKFDDRIALGAYPADIHPLSNCDMPGFLSGAHDTLPFYIPFRALTHYQFENLLVSGKTMAQSFLANSATRLHPIEWSSGTAAGVAAAYMAEKQSSSREALANIREVQERVSRLTPIDWTEPE